jgi:hypothetical protein
MFGRKTVHKQVIPVDDHKHEVKGFPIHVGTQDGEVVVWFEPDVDYSACLQIYGTGHNIPLNSDHIGSVTVGPFVWHVYLLYKVES